jgi:phosphotriesterase-related protein
MSGSVNTVIGTIAPDELGRTLVHEHVLFAYPGYTGDNTFGPFDHDAAVKRCVTACRSAKAHGVKTIIDATPNECGRDPSFLKVASEQTGINIICSTGYYYEGQGAPHYFNFRQAIGFPVEEEIYEMMVREITIGIGNTGVRAGVIKLGSSKNTITEYEQLFFRAGARAQRETGVPIITHTQEGTMGPE